MKKTYKKLVGLLGLVFVVAMTFFAAFLPGPEASATSGVTDTVTIVVVSGNPSASIDSPESGEVFLTPDHDIEIGYNRVKSYRLVLTYTDKDGVETTSTVVEENSPGDHGPVSYDFRPIAEVYGYGTYLFRLDAIGDDDVPLPGDSVEFKYIAIEAETTKDKDTGSTYVDIDFDQDQESLTEDLKIDQVVIYVYDKEGKLVTQMSPIVVKPPVERVEIVFPDDVPAGDYILVAEPFNSAGESLFRPVTMKVTYDGKEIDIVVPDTADTGGLFKNLNISKADYLITGIGFFLVIGIGSIFFINKRGKTSKRRK